MSEAAEKAETLTSPFVVVDVDTITHHLDDVKKVEADANVLFPERQGCGNLIALGLDCIIGATDSGGTAGCS